MLSSICLAARLRISSEGHACQSCSTLTLMERSLMPETQQSCGGCLDWEPRGCRQLLHAIRRWLQDLMAGLVLAEGFLPAARLKPWWRLWTFPAPLVSMGGDKP